MELLTVRCQMILSSGLSAGQREIGEISSHKKMFRDRLLSRRRKTMRIGVLSSRTTESRVEVRRHREPHPAKNHEAT